MMPSRDDPSCDRLTIWFFIPSRGARRDTVSIRYYPPTESMEQKLFIPSRSETARGSRQATIRWAKRGQHGGHDVAPVNWGRSIEDEPGDDDEEELRSREESFDNASSMLRSIGEGAKPFDASGHRGASLPFWPHGHQKASFLSACSSSFHPVRRSHYVRPRSYSGGQAFSHFDWIAARERGGLRFGANPIQNEVRRSVQQGCHEWDLSSGFITRTRTRAHRADHRPRFGFLIVCDRSTSGEGCATARRLLGTSY